MHESLISNRLILHMIHDDEDAGNRTAQNQVQNVMNHVSRGAHVLLREDQSPPGSSPPLL